MSKKVYVDAEVEVDLGEIGTSDLVEELVTRAIKGRELNSLLSVFELNGCPCDVLQPLRDWCKQPIITQKQLERWLEMCGVSGKEMSKQ